MTRHCGALLLIVALGCDGQAEPSGSPPAGFEYAYAGPSCAPWDGAAVIVVLRGAPLAAGDSVLEGGDAASLRVAIYPRDDGGTAPSGLRLASYRWPHQPEVAAGMLCERETCVQSPTGEITLREARADGSLSGFVDLRLDDGRTMRGGFVAEWRPRRMLCG